MGFPTSVGRDSCRVKNLNYTEVHRTLVYQLTSEEFFISKNHFQLDKIKADLAQNQIGFFLQKKLQAVLITAVLNFFLKRQEFPKDGDASLRGVAP